MREKREEKRFFSFHKIISFKSPQTLYIFIFFWVYSMKTPKENKSTEKVEMRRKKNVCKENECKVTLKFRINKNSNRHLIHCKIPLLMSGEKWLWHFFSERFERHAGAVSAAADVWRPTKSYRALIMCQQIERQTMTWLLLLQHENILLSVASQTNSYLKIIPLFSDNNVISVLKAWISSKCTTSNVYIDANTFSSLLHTHRHRQNVELLWILFSTSTPFFNSFFCR